MKLTWLCSSLLHGSLEWESDLLKVMKKQWKRNAGCTSELGIPSACYPKLQVLPFPISRILSGIKGYTKAFDCVDHNKLWKILKEMGIPDHLTCLLRNLYAGCETTVRTGHGTTDLFQIGEGVRQGCIVSPCLINLYAEYIMQIAGLNEAQAGIKIARRNNNNLNMQMTLPLWQKVKKN